MRRILATILFIITLPAFAMAQDTLKMSELEEEYREAKNDSVKLVLLLEVINSTELGDVDTAIYIAKKAADLALKLKDSISLAFAKQSLGVFYSVQSNHNEALRNDLEALNIYSKLGATTQQSDLLNAVGEDYLNLDLYNEAFNYYRQSLEKAQKQDDKLRIAITTYNMGRVLFAMGQLDRAREYIEESMEVSIASGDSAGIAYSKNDLARIDIEEGNYEKALTVLNEAYDVSIKFREDVLTPQIIANMAKAFEKNGQYRKALIHYDNALEIYEKQSNKNGIVEVFYGKGSVSQRMGDEIGAKAYFEKCQKMAEEIGDNGSLIRCYASMSELYESEKNLAKALEYYKKYKELEDSVFSEKKKEQFSQVQIQYETAKKDIEIQLLNQKERQQISELKNQEFIRNILVVILAFTAVLLFSLYKNNQRRKKVNDLLVIQQREIESKSKELSSLLEMKDKFFSIVSHDLRSPINALVGILDILDEGNMTQQELKEVSHALKLRLDNTRKLLDTLLDWAMMQMNEIKINLENIKLKGMVEDNFTFFREIGEKNIIFVNSVEADRIVKADKNMLDLIIRNLVSNSIKFTEDGGRVEISTEEGPKNMLIVMINDDGVGMAPEQMNKLFNTTELYTTRGTANEKGTGLGLKLCKEFVERMGGNIWVESEQGKGSTFKFTVSLA
ncbi:MAG: tetratricopeptide repeat-containing sensor histidine kinase [Fulvivirga sp.]|uniref:tetratricopeptide repeat-containing sensor histidine kinase n=1 Tax=Fulvivirga sp. TaxID=1931237 RepID=UPI0032ED7D0E